MKNNKNEPYRLSKLFIAISFISLVSGSITTIGYHYGKPLFPHASFLYTNLIPWIVGGISAYIAHILDKRETAIIKNQKEKINEKESAN